MNKIIDKQLCKLEANEMTHFVRVFRNRSFIINCLLLLAKIFIFVHYHRSLLNFGITPNPNISGAIKNSTHIKFQLVGHHVVHECCENFIFIFQGIFGNVYGPLFFKYFFVAP